MKNKISHSGEIIKKALNEKDMTQTELANRIGRNQTLISRYILGQIEISDKAARAIADVLDLDFEELSNLLQRDRLRRQQEKLNAEFKDIIDDEDDTPTHEVGGATLMEELDIVTVPLLDSTPINPDQLTGSYETFPVSTRIIKESQKVFALEVKQERITDDKVDPGDILVVEISPEIKDGDRIIAIIHDEPVLGKIYHMDENFAFQHLDAQKKQTMLLSRKDKLVIIGKVLVCIKLF
ncbi:helix-turn-helix domain-containing protein [Candidatus Poribacteria bacterium]|nr:helix-turn-helix domain-containing protein [Candidatus Poribacteria bacterium]